ncbi:MAG: hypothetical protein EZS28_050898, partial [Streblomastix strix]
MIKSFYGRELSTLRTFQLFVNAIEVFYKASRREYHSANSEVKMRSPSFCIDDVDRFLQLCVQIARFLLLTSNSENLDSNKMCLDDIMGIKKHYSDICTAATSIHFLNHINIFGRNWHPELLVKVKKEVQEQKIESIQQKTNENGQKRRRTDENEDEQDITQYPLEPPKTLKEDDEFKMKQKENKKKTKRSKEDDEFIMEQQKDKKVSKKQKEDKKVQKKQKQKEDDEFKEITDQFRERIVQSVNEKFDDLNDSQFLISTNQQHEPNNIPQIDASPLSQPFSQECVQLPFYNACRQDEGQEVVQKIFQKSEQGEEMKKRRK